MTPQQWLSVLCRKIALAVMRNGTPDSVTMAAAECHRHAGARYSVGAGCEIPVATPPENLRALGEYARSHKPAAIFYG